VRPFVERGLARGDVRLMHAWLPDDAPEALQVLVHEASGQEGKDSPDAGPFRVNPSDPTPS